MTASASERSEMHITEELQVQEYIDCVGVSNSPLTETEKDSIELDQSIDEFWVALESLEELLRLFVIVRDQPRRINIR